MRVLFASIEWPFEDQSYRGPFAKNLADALQAHVEVIPFPLPIRRNPLNILRYRYQLHQAYQKYQCDHLHCYSLHSLWMANPQKQMVSASAIGTDVFGSPDQQGLYPRGGSWTYRLLRSSMKDLRGIRAVSESMKSCLRHEITGKVPIDVLPNGLKINSFPPKSREAACQKLGWDPDQIHVFFPGNPDRPVKNFALAKKWIAEVQKSKAVSLHTFPGVKPDQMNDYYRAADLVLITSYHEGSSNALKEALLCQTPVISMPVGDAPYWLSNSPIGQLINFEEDVQVFQTLLEQAVDDKHHQYPGIDQTIAEQLGIDMIAKQFADFIQSTNQPIY